MKKQIKKVVLILEDEQPLLQVIKAKFETEGLSVATAKSTAQALDYFKNRIKIDAVWLDHYLFGKEDGLDFLSKLRRIDQGKNLPVFLISNTASAEKIQAYQKLKIKKCYTKVDFKLEEIVKDIKEYLECSKNNK